MRELYQIFYFSTNILGHKPSRPTLSQPGGGHAFGHVLTRHNAPDLAEQVNDLKNLVPSMQNGGMKVFSFYEICLYPFDKYINMQPFSPNFEIKKIDKYKGKTRPIQHLK